MVEVASGPRPSQAAPREGVVGEARVPIEGPAAGIRRAARVLLFVDSFDHGGSQGQLVELADGLAGDPGFDVWIGCLRQRGPLLRRLVVPTTRIREYRLTRFYDARGAGQIARLAWDLGRLRMDLVHAFDFYANVMCAAAAGLNPRTRLIVSRRYDRLSDRRLHRLGEAWSYRLADAVVINSAMVARDVAQRFGLAHEKIAIIANGVDLARFAHQPPPVRSDASRGRMRLGVVARLAREKGLDVLLEATRLLVERSCDVEVVVVGEGELRPELEQAVARLGLEDRVEFVGAHADVHPWLATFDVAVLPSRGEGLPNALLEYLASGRPVVATRVGAVPEVLNDPGVGVVVPPDEPRSLADALEVLLRDAPRRAAMSLAAKRRAADYALEAMVERTTLLYRALLGPARRVATESFAASAPGSL